MSWIRTFRISMNVCISVIWQKDILPQPCLACPFNLVPSYQNCGWPFTCVLYSWSAVFRPGVAAGSVQIPFTCPHVPAGSPQAKSCTPSSHRWLIWCEEVSGLGSLQRVAPDKNRCLSVYRFIHSAGVFFSRDKREPNVGRKKTYMEELNVKGTGVKKQ